MLAQTPTRPTSMTRVVLSYWRSVEGLQAFTVGPKHREGWDWWNRTVYEHPHLGIMHEVYAAPPGAWENINVNFIPFGIGKSRLLPFDYFKLLLFFSVPVDLFLGFTG